MEMVIVKGKTVNRRGINGAGSEAGTF